MKRSLHLFALLTLLVPAAHAQRIIRNDSIMRYNPEQGYFQKAYVDASDPRFMLANQDGTFYFGVGGQIRFTPYYDFVGATDSQEFSTADIEMPTSNARHFGYAMLGTHLYIKTRIKIGQRYMVGYIRFQPNADNEITLGQAYLSYYGFTIGRTYTLFNDLQAGVQTVDTKGVCTSVGGCNYMIAYNHSFSPNWQVGVAAEKPSFPLPTTTSSLNYSPEANAAPFTDRLYEEYQGMPNLIARVIYQGKHGHFQAAALYRHLHYYLYDDLQTYQGTSHTVSAYGFALSGTWNINQRLFLTGSYVGGKGIGEYVNALGGKGFDTYIDLADDRLQPYGAAGAYVGLQYTWNQKRTLASSLVGGALLMDDDDPNRQFRASYYIAANLFWNINPFLQVGGEVCFGAKTNKVTDATSIYYNAPAGSRVHGIASRFNIMAQYTF